MSASLEEVRAKQPFDEVLRVAARLRPRDQPVRIPRVRLALDALERELDADRPARGADALVDFGRALRHRRISPRDRRAGRCRPRGRSGLSWNGCQLTMGRNSGSRAAYSESASPRRRRPMKHHGHTTSEMTSIVMARCGSAAVMSGPGCRQSRGQSLCALRRGPARDNGHVPDAQPCAHAARPSGGTSSAGSSTISATPASCWRLARQLAAEHAQRRDAVAGRPRAARADRARHRSGRSMRSRRRA